MENNKIMQKDKAQDNKCAIKDKKKSKTIKK